MSNARRLLAHNMALSVVSVVIAMLVFYLLSLCFNAITDWEVFVLLWRYELSGTAGVDRYQLVRDMFLIIGAAVGLASAQVTFVLSHLNSKASA
jgi:hypothetical protein